MRQGSAVAQIGLGNLQMQLQRMAKATVDLPELAGKSPPRLRLKLNLLDAAQFSVDGAGRGASPVVARATWPASNSLDGAFRAKGLGCAKPSW